MDKYDVIIVGGGPAGLTASIYAVRANMKTLVLDKLAPGGQIIQTGPGKGKDTEHPLGAGHTGQLFGHRQRDEILFSLHLGQGRPGGQGGVCIIYYLIVAPFRKFQAELWALREKESLFFPEGRALLQLAGVFDFRVVPAGDLLWHRLFSVLIPLP